MKLTKQAKELKSQLDEIFGSAYILKGESNLDHTQIVALEYYIDKRMISQQERQHLMENNILINIKDDTFEFYKLINEGKIYEFPILVKIKTLLEDYETNFSEIDDVNSIILSEIKCHEKFSPNNVSEAEVVLHIMQCAAFQYKNRNRQ